MRRALATVAVVVALAGCSSSSDGPKDQLSLEPSTTTTTTPATAALAARLPTAVLDGFTRADAAFGSGPIDLAGAASSANDTDAERTRLEQDGFVRGITRSWVNGVSADTVYAAIYEFGDEAGATRYATSFARQLATQGATEVADGVFTTVEPDGEATLTTHAAFRQVGNRWALVLVASERADRTPAEAGQIAAEIKL